MKKIGFIAIIVAVASLSTLATMVVVGDFGEPKEIIVQPGNSGIQVPSYPASNSGIPSGSTDFTIAAEASVHAVVHVKKTYTQRIQTNPFYDFFGDGYPYGNKERKAVGTGSGVIISPDGYVVSNNHVVEGADEVLITLNDRKEYPAKVIGTDPSTDLALLKIDEDNLPYLSYGNSDDSKVGEWVMAVGNPFELTSTVTAGIISAKGRNINLLSKNSNTPIESFIQTDAVVNPGNSGGALVNLKGELIGINTAIASPTGSYAGYAFAVPVNIVSKVVEDLMEFGTVQRGFLGVSIGNISPELAEEMDLTNLEGVFIARVNEGSGAEDAGIEEGDIILAVNNISVKTSPELQEQVSKYRPGDKISVKLLRDGKNKLVDVVLKNRANTTELIEKGTSAMSSKLGVDFRTLTEEESRKLKINGGVEISGLYNGVISENTNIRVGFIVTKIDHKRISSVEELEAIMGQKSSGDGVLIEGFYPKYRYKTLYYAFGI